MSPSSHKSLLFFLKFSFSVRLNRRRAKEGLSRVSNSKLVVKHRELNDQEIDAQV